MRFDHHQHLTVDEIIIALIIIVSQLLCGPVAGLVSDASAPHIILIYIGLLVINNFRVAIESLDWEAQLQRVCFDHSSMVPENLKQIFSSSEADRDETQAAFSS